MVSLPSCGDRRRDNRIVAEKIGGGKIERFTNLFEIFNGRRDPIEFNLGEKTWRTIGFLSHVSK
jgi:hypothetical protein